MNKKAQWVRAQMREQRSRERSERVFMTYAYLQENYSIESISHELGVSPNTVRGYVSEVNANKSYYESEYEKRLNQIETKNQEKECKLNRTDSQIYGEEIGRGLLKGFGFCAIALLWWWFPSIIWFVISNGSPDITSWIYSVQGFITCSIIVGAVFSFNKISKAKKERAEYNETKTVQVESVVKKKDNKYEFKCPACEKTFELNISKLPPKGQNSTMVCIHCKKKMETSLPDSMYVCVGCSKTFNTITERFKHQGTCKRAKNKSQTCSKCKINYTLDDSEYLELLESGKVTVVCPGCGGKNTHKK